MDDNHSGMNEGTSIKEVKVLLVGIGGYGGIYTSALLDEGTGRGISIAGFVDPKPQACGRIEEIKVRGIPVYDRIENFYKEKDADLAVISTPIQFHKQHILQALAHGSGVLCEKPLCAGIQDGKDIIEQAGKSGKVVSIGYQWSFCKPILDLKEDIMKGLFGRPKNLKTFVSWPRSFGYYARNSWAGRVRDAGGNLVLDSVANNATAHYLHNMFYVLGNSRGESAFPVKVKAELYRANDIENYDTGIIRAFTDGGIEIFFVVSHAADITNGPVFEYVFDKAVIHFDRSESNNIYAVFNDGKIKHYGDPFADDMNKLWQTIDVVRNGEGVSPCPPEAAFAHTLCIIAAQESCPVIKGFPKELITVYDISENERGVFVKGLYDILDRCYKTRTMPGESGISWSTQGKVTDVRMMDG